MNNQDFEQSSAQESIADLINLPDEQRQIVTFIIRQQKATLAEIAVHTNLPEGVIQQHLNNLINQTFIQEIIETDTIYYQPKLPSKNKNQLNQNIWNKL
ncbi:ArsR family transcriptional regulator [Nostoc sp. CENA67]|uniref:ArsR family transcriptional regulator n=1 Tax=Amazonocrinis nigriterrae CENA67 TaxID=2794033 RepID=A0A8J7HUT1_9NOST|nr:ArsR family transcriptional regulator [Amazonocrinis nigriterrae]MBH8566323.1 ArsR family transcriptional regulator [Amazonocrinis nigriterrae CENA67]